MSLATISWQDGRLVIIDQTQLPARCVEKELKTEVRGTTDDRKFSLEVNRCVGACGLAPVVTVGKDIYRRVKIDKIPRILANYK